MSRSQTFSLEKIASLSSHAAMGAYLINLFANDLLGRDSIRAKTFQVKCENVFEERHSIPIWVKVAVIVFILLFNIFAVLFCALNGRDKGTRWQIAWLYSSLVKVILDVLIARVLVIVVIRFYIPEFLHKEVNIIKAALISGAHELVKANHRYNLDKFSYSDYMNVSSFVARMYPDMVESKLILMYRNALPGELGVSPMSTRIDWHCLTFREICGHIFVIALLNFGALPGDLQKGVVMSVPTVMLTLFVSVVAALKETSIVAFYILCVICALGFCYGAYCLLSSVGHNSKSRRPIDADDNSLKKYSFLKTAY